MCVFYKSNIPKKYKVIKKPRRLSNTTEWMEENRGRKRRRGGCGGDGNTVMTTQSLVTTSGAAGGGCTSSLASPVGKVEVRRTEVRITMSCRCEKCK